ncbi:MATH domain and coiled-coil domain-containing protein At3g58200-like [Neltuma alba]|uniref:MATH domain and coiled-coil domain-containing protein At3g58200-like n=1 Tax=Neltuma alba TaxID=207710 RepID=UPI0010A2E295|nr:MATH domain and coiled-coil domain-containing protein At3g58200-like [Prosopis alba]
MKNQEPKDISCKKIAWTIKNFSKLKTNTPYYSEVFTIGDRAWKVALYRGRQDGKSLAIYLRVADDLSLPQGWCIYVEYAITVVHQVSRENSIKRGPDEGIPSKFDAKGLGWGYLSFMPLSTLEDPSSGYISKDECTVEVEIYSVKSEGINKPTSHPAYPSLFKQVKETPADPKDDDDDFVDFKDLGRIEKSFVPLLEEVCSSHPLLLDCKKNKSRRFTEWAFTALGRVLQFLKNKKWKDMNDEACEQLQYLWDEIEMSRLARVELARAYSEICFKYERI